MGTNDNGSNTELIKSDVSLGALVGAQANNNTPPVTPPQLGEPNVPQGTNPPNPVDGQGTNPPNNPPAGVTPPAAEPVGLPETFNELLPLLSANTNDNAEATKLKGQILDTFKATAIDSKGNLLDSQGNVIFKAETLQKFIDSDELPVNDKGELVNEKGEVVRQVAEPKKIVTELKASVEQDFGIKFADDVDFPDTEEGLKLLLKEGIKAKATNAVKTFLETNPELKGFYQHLALGGKPEEYSSKNIDYKSINIKQLDEPAKLDLISKMFTAQGLPNKDNLLQLIKTAGTDELDKNVAAAVLFLDKQQADYRAQQDALIAKAQEDEAKEVEAYWNEVNNLVVKSGKINNITIPATEREAFFDYMSKPITADYHSADSVAAQKDSLEFQTLVSYLRFKGGDISKLAQIIAKEERVKSLSERLARVTETDNGNGVPNTATQTNRSSSVSLSQLLGGNK